MADHGVVRHLTELFRIERTRFAEQAAVDGHFADVMQIARAAQRGNFAGIRAHGFANRSRVAAHAQRVAVKFTCFTSMAVANASKSAVIEAVQRRHQAQVLGYALGQRLSQRVVVDSQPNVAAQQIRGIQFRLQIGRVTRPPSQRDDSGELANRFERGQCI